MMRTEVAHLTSLSDFSPELRAQLRLLLADLQPHFRFDFQKFFVFFHQNFSLDTALMLPIIHQSFLKHPERQNSGYLLLLQETLRAAAVVGFPMMSKMITGDVNMNTEYYLGKDSLSAKSLLVILGYMSEVIVRWYPQRQLLLRQLAEDSATLVHTPAAATRILESICKVFGTMPMIHALPNTQTLPVEILTDIQPIRYDREEQAAVYLPDIELYQNILQYFQEVFLWTKNNGKTDLYNKVSQYPDWLHDLDHKTGVSHQERLANILHMPVESLQQAIASDV